MFGALQPPSSGRERIGTHHYYPGKKYYSTKHRAIKYGNPGKTSYCFSTKK